MRISRTLTATALATSLSLSLSAVLASGEAKDEPQSRSDSQSQAEVIMLLVPVDMERDATRSGCWARMYSKNLYLGEVYTVVGPTSMSSMDGRFGGSFGSMVNSIKVGPKARLTLYDNEAFNDRNVTVTSNQQVPDLDEKLGMFDKIASLKLTCSS